MILTYRATTNKAPYSPRHHWHCYILRDLRDCQADTLQWSRKWTCRTWCSRSCWSNLWHRQLGFGTFHGRLNVVVSLLIEVQIYPIDVVKTQFQKRQLETGRAQVSRPDIKFFQPGSYRGEPIETAYLRASTKSKTGLGVSVGRSALINMIFFSSFEQIKKRINNAGDI